MTRAGGEASPCDVARRRLLKLPRAANMIVVGIAGGVASGKSFVARGFQRLGAVVLDADAIGRQVLHMETVKKKLRNHWGDAVFDPNGEIDRRLVAERVFGANRSAAEELAFLESVTHPEIGTLLRKDLARLAEQRDAAVVVLDAAVMFKAGWRDMCDTIVFVDAPESVRRQRAAARGWTAEQFASREAAQTPLEEKRAAAGDVIDNSGSESETMRQIEVCWRRWTQAD